jgi:hypothetical protein
MDGDSGVTVGAAVFLGGSHVRKRDRQACAPKHDERDEVVNVAKAVACAYAEFDLVVYGLDAGVGQAVADSCQQ